MWTCGCSVVGHAPTFLAEVMESRYVLEIGLGKLPEESQGSFVISSCGFLGGLKPAEVLPSCCVPDFRHPFSPRFVEGDPPIPRSVTGVPANTIDGVLGARCLAKIASPIVESVAIDVVDIDTLGHITKGVDATAPFGAAGPLPWEGFAEHSSSHRSTTYGPERARRQRCQSGQLDLW